MAIGLCLSQIINRGSNMRASGDPSHVRFVAYVYPGWHSSAYRPAVDEWDLLDTFHPCFAGHQPPARPLAGRYDDSTPEVSAAHEREALEAGIEAFTYFTYY